MTVADRLPAPLADAAREGLGGERASATPARLDLGNIRAPERRARTTGRALDDLQRWMIQGITGSEDDAADAGDMLTPGPRMTARERFEVYRSGYRGRLVECLLDDYPILARALGDDAFVELCHLYVERHPSRAPNLNWFGRHMASFCLEVDLEAIAPLRTFAAELATLEWALVEVLHAATPPALDAAALQAIPIESWGDAKLVASDAVRLLRFTHPVNAWFQSRRTSDDAVPLPAPAPSATAVYRKDLVLWRMDLTPAMTRVVAALLEGRTIGEALEQIGVDESDATALAEAERSVMVWFRAWVDAGFFARVELGPR